MLALVLFEITFNTISSTISGRFKCSRGIPPLIIYSTRGLYYDIFSPNKCIGMSAFSCWFFLLLCCRSCIILLLLFSLLIVVTSCCLSDAHGPWCTNVRRWITRWQRQKLSKVNCTTCRSKWCKANKIGWRRILSTKILKDQTSREVFNYVSIYKIPL